MHAKYGFSSQCIVLFGTEKSGLADQIEIKSDVQMLNMKYLFYIKLEKRKYNKFQNIIINSWTFSRVVNKISCFNK